MNTTSSVARDVFMYLLVVVVLAMSATSLGLLLSDMVNVYLPDPMRSVCAYDGCTGAVNGEVAVLLVAFPVLLWAWRFIRHDIAAHPEKADLRVRRWLLYLTLFVSGITAIVDIIQLVSGWLGGELTVQSLLKIAIVLAIALTTFFYFLRELHEKKSGTQRLIAWAVMGVVAASLAAGIYTSAPWQARDRANDRQRVYDLQSIQSQIVTFWMAKERMPASLDALRDPVSGFVAPTDPVSNEAYIYTVRGATSFRLCATFTTVANSDSAVRSPTPVSVDGDLYAKTWDHGVGTVCFDRTIDPQLYPPKK